MPEKNKHSDPTPIESAAQVGLPLVGAATAIEALDTYNYIDADWMEQVPAADHLSSIAGSYVIGAVGGAATERLAARLELHGRDKPAEYVRRAGKIITVMGSIACQLAIETSTRGTGDKWDVVSGALATMPGLIAGRGFAKATSPSEQPGKHAAVR